MPQGRLCWDCVFRFPFFFPLQERDCQYSVGAFFFGGGGGLVWSGLVWVGLLLPFACPCLQRPASTHDDKADDKNDDVSDNDDYDDDDDVDEMMMMM